jgi:hypothetical protein
MICPVEDRVSSSSQARIHVFIAAAVVAVALVGCGSDEKNAAPQADRNPGSERSEQQSTTSSEVSSRGGTKRERADRSRQSEEKDGRRGSNRDSAAQADLAAQKQLEDQDAADPRAPSDLGDQRQAQHAQKPVSSERSDLAEQQQAAAESP